MIYNKDGKIVLGDIPNFIQIFHNIVGIGDSLMCGYAATSDITIGSPVAREKGANWLAYMGLDIGRTPTNLAVGNTTTHDWRYATNNADISVAEDVTADCYIVALGVNDSRQSKAIGTSADIAQDKSNNADSYYGNLDYIVRTLHGYNTNAHIFVFTIPGSETLKDSINTAIRHIAGLYAYVHCIDLDAEHADDYTAGFISNNFYGGHYNAITYRLMASYIKQSISEYMYKNYSLFKNVPYQL